ncbi:hypothetical protein PF005_g19712 [Phytophthora fragariae]|uniref:Uncharacterized protein n=1 Tax=Phytophthora fragariae TaxID=53985 RepID=A0A6A3RGM3_9STRA|nr:hypothetical protein PF003_g14111 [Phytophthora fragariae]KAE8933546.1 hypothetical protein PF009_g16459 [Phytophthora fragariae]KAE8990104.1 hypothetical protein PF011_g18489 [Phytophthora fragariae]KAE9091037.1 hypothetical protein PF010_g18350 [Phytophthora fragariae]KAE9097007.1 hypothetical protein PF007_g16773 [Phytophthora fragariae]
MPPTWAASLPDVVINDLLDAQLMCLMPKETPPAAKYTGRSR